VFDIATTLDILRDGEIEILGRIIGSSNNALFVTVTRVCPDPEPAQVLEAIYKPIAGERPLDDFPDGTLSKREVAAWLVSEATGWGLVPPTVLREGPFGLGMVQQYVDADPAVDVVAMVVDDDPRLRPMAVFDAIVNNTDRKGGHILPVEGGSRILGVDHGVCFSPVPKLRTVLWGWRGERFEPTELEGLSRVRTAIDGPLGADLGALLSRAEIRATTRRLDHLLSSQRFPMPSPTWPSIPWPPF